MPSQESRQPPIGERQIGAEKEAASQSTTGSPGDGGLRTIVWAVAGILFLIGAAAGITSPWWFPQLNSFVAGDPPAASSSDDHVSPDQQTATGGSHGHSHAEGAATVTLSRQARENIGLILTTVELQDFARTVSMPATIVGRPGQTEIAVSAPMTGMVTRIYVMRGEAVLQGTPMFDLRLTHEDLVEKQSSLLRSLEELDVVKQEVARLEDVTASGAVAGKRILERQYEHQKIEAAIRAERQALLLHGLTDEQIEHIAQTRQLLQRLTIFAPPLSDEEGDEEHVEYLQVAEIPVKVGEHVATGKQLATVTDHCELLVEGKAFEQDADALNQAANAKVDVTALVNVNGSEKLSVPNLRILYVENQVERDSRALKFYVRLPNELVRNDQTSAGHRFIGWRYRPGQRVELLVPVEQWENRIVLPVEAVVQEGPEAYVFQAILGHFDRKAVHIEYRDQRHAVLADDGTLRPGNKVVSTGAYQLHLAMKNKAGGSANSHAGHHH